MVEAPGRLGDIRHTHVGREARVVRVPALGAVVGPLPHPLSPDLPRLAADAVHPGGPKRSQELCEIRLRVAGGLDEMPHRAVVELGGGLHRAVRRHRGLLADPTRGRPPRMKAPNTREAGEASLKAPLFPAKHPENEPSRGTE